MIPSEKTRKNLHNDLFSAKLSHIRIMCTRGLGVYEPRTDHARAHVYSTSVLSCTYSTPAHAQALKRWGQGRTRARICVPIIFGASRVSACM